jgi:uncharacterized LabA/DUF88 family protein
MLGEPRFVQVGQPNLDDDHRGAIGRDAGAAVQRAIAYVDGFNVYHGLRQLTGRRYLWLDLQDLCERLIGDGGQLLRIRYFTARVRNDLPSEQRQDRYLQALAAYRPTVEITEGRFQKQTRQCRSCAAQWITYVEKESDVNIAISLVEDAAHDRFDTALLISGDSDLSPAIRAAKRLRPGTQIVAAFPPRRASDPIRKLVDRTLHIDKTMLRNSQLPDEVVTASGIKLSRPAHWN